jgi:hypothetical protein
MTATVRVPNRVEPITGRPEYLRVIHTCNAIAPGMFGSAIDSGPWWAGGEVERYADARVIFRPGDQGVSIVALTGHGDTVLRAAAELLGIETGETGLPDCASSTEEG